ncbi:MAG: hypothetical protein LJF30_00950 [Acidobacteria bacterium]|nr:hypothetical protein [Acidobacteriota bacterium]
MVQTFGDRANVHPHVYAPVTRGGWTRWTCWSALWRRDTDHRFHHGAQHHQALPRPHPQTRQGLSSGRRSGLKPLCQ